MGHIYVIHVTDTNIYKIGYTDSCIKQRVSDFKSKCSFPCQLVRKIECSNAKRVETMIHKQFASKNVKVYGIYSKEIFRLDLDDCAQLCEMLSPYYIHALGIEDNKVQEFLLSLDTEFSY